MRVLHIRVPQDLEDQIETFMGKNNDWIPNKSQMIRMAIEHFLESCDHLRKMIGKDGLPVMDNPGKELAVTPITQGNIHTPNLVPEQTINQLSSTEDVDESFSVLGDFN